jgi:hypothetical protein
MRSIFFVPLTTTPLEGVAFLQLHTEILPKKIQTGRLPWARQQAFSKPLHPGTIARPWFARDIIASMSVGLYSLNGE